MKTRKELEFYAFRMDFNSNDLVRVNVLTEFQDKKEVKKQMKYRDVKTRDDFKNYVKRVLMYNFWSKAEHEVMVSELFHKPDENSHKIDIWYQLEPNLDVITDLIINFHNLEF